MQVPNRAVRRAMDAAASGPELARRLTALLPRALDLLDAAEQVLGRFDALLDRLDRTEAELHAVVRRVAATQREIATLLEPTLARSVETLAYASEQFGPDQIDSFIAMLGHESILRDLEPLLPVLAALETVAPDLKELIAVSRGLNELMGSVPGMGRAKRRVDDELETLQREEAEGETDAR